MQQSTFWFNRVKYHSLMTTPMRIVFSIVCVSMLIALDALLVLIAEIVLRPHGDILHATALVNTVIAKTLLVFLGVQLANLFEFSFFRDDAVEQKTG